MADKPVCALIYDFDGTLAPGNCADHGLLPKLGIKGQQDKTKFWNQVREKATAEDADEIVVYMRELSRLAMENKRRLLAPKKLRKLGDQIPFFEGVEGWFPILNRFADKLGVELFHYVVSSGLEEMIRGCRIAEHFEHVFACRYGREPERSGQYWPVQTVNYTTKTQFLFRINKGVINSWDNERLNTFTPESQRPVPFKNMIYLGDGFTDIPSMKTVRQLGGKSIAVFDQKQWDTNAAQNTIEELITAERADYFVPAVYSQHSQLYVTVRAILRSISNR